MDKDISIGEIVASDFRAAAIFTEAGIDFCCGGNKSVDDACREAGVEKQILMKRLAELETAPPDNVHNFKEWDPGFLCDYIVNTHHRYVMKTLPELLFYTGKIAYVHGDRHAELIEAESLFSEIARELPVHIKKEEELFFPVVKDFLATGSKEKETSLAEQIAVFSEEHEFAGTTMDEIRSLTGNYNVPSDGCNTYQVTFRLLKEFEDDLHIHVHLENNILFPAIIKTINQY
jgi:regulator of cell morphogenesis and NO signaling